MEAKRKTLLYLIIILVIIKIGFVCINNNKLGLNTDEHTNYRIASNYLKGRGYTIFDDKTNSYKQTSFLASFPVFTYIFLQKINLTEESLALIIHSLATVLYAISILYFYRTVKIFFPNNLGCLIASSLYGLYPPVVYYIGSLSIYENIAMPILIIIMYKLIKYSTNSPVRYYDFIIIPVLVTISCLYRSQLIFIYFGIFLIFFIIIVTNYIKNKYKIKNLIWILILTTTTVTLAHVPVFKKNHTMFGSYILSTQPGFELLLGHNPLARGSYWGSPDSIFYKYVREQIPNTDYLNEYEESLVRRNLAIKWILDNPLSELKLMARKIAIYFLPQNYSPLPGSRLYNPINLIVHLLFLLSCMLTLIRFRTIRIRKEDILVLSPIIFSILLSLIFFVGYRWRYYAEPFMIIYSFLFIQKLKASRLKKVVL